MGQRRASPCVATWGSNQRLTWQNHVPTAPVQCVAHQLRPSSTCHHWGLHERMMQMRASVVPLVAAAPSADLTMAHPSVTRPTRRLAACRSRSLPSMTCTRPRHAAAWQQACRHPSRTVAGLERTVRHPNTQVCPCSRCPGHADCCCSSRRKQLHRGRAVTGYCHPFYST
jgi:hypothetical protein